MRTNREVVLQVEIKVVVGINNNKHANIIVDDIIELVKTRTTVYYVSKPEHAKESVSQLWEVDVERGKEIVDP